MSLLLSGDDIIFKSVSSSEGTFLEPLESTRQSVVIGSKPQGRLIWKYIVDLLFQRFHKILLKNHDKVLSFIVSRGQWKRYLLCQESKEVSLRLSHTAVLPWTNYFTSSGFVLFKLSGGLGIVIFSSRNLKKCDRRWFLINLPFKNYLNFLGRLSGSVD